MIFFWLFCKYIGSSKSIILATLFLIAMDLKQYWSLLQDYKKFLIIFNFEKALSAYASMIRAFESILQAVTTLLGLFGNITLA